MNDNDPVTQTPPSSFPLASDVAKHIAGILATADGKRSLERLLGELALLPAYEVVPQENGMVAMGRAGGEGSLLLFPTAAFIPMMAETVLKFMLPKALQAQVKPGLGEAEIAFLLAGGK
ncbi:MAG: hypothetical protein OEL53_04925 [Rhodospirillales bacterium]|nr:hypothetical protein [Rhodospirillales bacterium]